MSTITLDGEKLSRAEVLGRIDAVIRGAQEMATDEDRADPLRGTMLRNPRLTAHVICASLGYATPSTAARIVADARAGRGNWCEWVSSCYGGDPKGAVRKAILGRHDHQGFMAEYVQALALVARALRFHDEPVFASWF